MCLAVSYPIQRERNGDEGPLNFNMDNVHCDGSESKLSDCNHLGLGDRSCLTEEAAGVICTSMFLFIGNALHV